MKTKLTRAAGLLLLLLTSHFVFAALGGGSIMGQVVDPETKEPVADAMVVLDNQGTQKIYYTNENGYYYASNIPAGTYTITVSYLTSHSTVAGVVLANEEARTVDLKLKPSADIEVVWEEPLIDPLEVRKEKLDRDIIKHMPITNVEQIAETFAATVKIGHDYYVRGARAGGLAYYIDGGKVLGSPNIPLCGLQTYRTYDSFIPAKYGDALGAVVVIETRNYYSEQR